MTNGSNPHRYDPAPNAEKTTPVSTFRINDKHLLLFNKNKKRPEKEQRDSLSGPIFLLNHTLGLADSSFTLFQCPDPDNPWKV